MKNHLTLLGALALALPPLAQAATNCQATSNGAPPTVLELYTSEGCSSCPPADRWLSQLKGRPDVLALAFHVNYWDKLGWPDRFASAEGTQRQHQLAQRSGAANVYTPQVVANGTDWPAWHGAKSLPRSAAAKPPQLTLQRDGDTVSAQVASGSNAQLGGYWAVLEDQHESRVRSGENAGATLKHDHVVRLYRPVSAWSGQQAQRHTLQVSRGVPEHPRRVVFVVTDGSGARPLQAVSLDC